MRLRRLVLNDGNNGQGLTLSPLRIAVALSRHGYGHLVRTAEVLEHLAAMRPVELTVHSTLPSALWPRALSHCTSWIAEDWDCGVLQSDDLTVDPIASEQAVSQWLEDAPAILSRATASLNSGFDLLLGDVPPLAFEAAAAAKLPSFAIANFSWDWIYREMGFKRAADRAASAYEKADLLFALSPDTPMPAFNQRIDVGLLGRGPSRLRYETRQRLGLRLEERLILVSFRGAGSGIVRLPEPGLDLRWLLPTERADLMSRGDCMVAPNDINWIDLVAACDVVVSKPGYGIYGDTAATGTPFLYASRRGFPEDQFLERGLRKRKTARAVDANNLAAGTWSEDLEALLSLEKELPQAAPAASRIAKELNGRFRQ